MQTDTLPDAKAAPISTLQEEQIAEIKKVFSMVDKDGSGAIDSKELGQLLTILSGGVQPAKEDVDALVKKMDTDSNGIIDFKEFVDCLHGWLQEEGRDESTIRKTQTSNANKAREQIHKRISSFFTQFKRASNFDEIRAKMAADAKANEGKEAEKPLDPNQKQWTAKEKLERLAICKKLMEQLSPIVAGLQSNNPKAALECTKGLAEILAIVEVFVTPEDRYEIGPELLVIFQRIQEAGVIPRIVAFLAVQQPELQFHAARVITYFAPGPRIAHTPKDSILHPDKMQHKTMCIMNGAVDALIRLLASNVPAVQEQAVVALGKIAQYDPQARDLLLMKGVFKVMFENINDGMRLSLLQKVTWCLSIFCGATHPKTAPPKYDVVSKALPKLAYLFFRSTNDEETLINVITCWGLLLPGVVVEDTIMQQLTKCLAHPAVRVQRVVLQVITEILRFDNAAGNKILSNPLMKALGALMRNTTDHLIQADCVELVAIVAGEKGFLHAVLQNGLAEALVFVLGNQERLRTKVVRVLKSLTRGAQQQVQYLVEKVEIVKVLCRAFEHFKQFDSVLRDTYKFMGAAYNFDLVADLVEGLDNVLKAGEQPGGNIFAKYYDLEVVDKVKTLMHTLCGEAVDQIDAWRAGGDSGDPIEDKLCNFLLRIKLIHEKYRTPLAEAMSKQIIEIGKDFTAKLAKSMAAYKQKRLRLQAVKEKKISAAAAGAGVYGGPAANGFAAAAAAGAAVPFGGGVASAFGDTTGMSGVGLAGAAGYTGAPVSIKCFFNGDNRVLEVPRDISLKDLQLRIQLKYGAALLLQYEDSDGDKISIDSPEILAKAMAQWDRQQSYKLFLLGRGGAAAAAAAGAGAAAGMAGMAVDSKGVGGFNAAGWYMPESKHALIDELKYRTKFNKHDLEKLYAQFQKTAKGGRLNKQQFEHGLKSIGQTDQVMIDQMFTAFDNDKDGLIDFREFACGLSVMYSGSMEERLEMAFKAYDKNGDGTISREELFDIVKATFRTKGFDHSDAMINDLVQKCFDTNDVNRDGALDLEEFKNAVMQHNIIVQSFWRTSI